VILIDQYTQKTKILSQNVSLLLTKFGKSELPRCSAITERTRCRMHYSFRQKWKTGTERQYFTDIIGLSSTTVISATKSVKSGEKCKMKAIKAFKVIEVGTNQKLLCEFLLVINSNWHPISYRFGVIAAYCSNFGHFAFWSHPLGA